jgi:hypothetical protein
MFMKRFILPTLLITGLLFSCNKNIPNEIPDEITLPKPPADTTDTAFITLKSGIIVEKR